MRMSSFSQTSALIDGLNGRSSSPSLISIPDTEEEPEFGVERVVLATSPELEAAERADGEAQRNLQEKIAAAVTASSEQVAAKAAANRCKRERERANPPVQPAPPPIVTGQMVRAAHNAPEQVAPDFQNMMDVLRVSFVRPQQVLSLMI